MSPARRLLTHAYGVYRGARLVAAGTAPRLTVFAAFALAAAWPLLSTAASLNEFRDAHVLGHYEAVARETVLRWHQAPLWDPYYCGGMVLLGTPQSRFLSPTFLMTLLFGEARGEALTAFFMMLLGLEGAYRYARSWRATSLGAMLAAPVFALSGVFAVSPGLGWTNFFGFELLPWIALGARAALRGRERGAALGALAMAWCVGMGGTYAAPLAAVLAGFEAVAHLARNVRRPDRLVRGLAMALVAAALAAGLSAVRLWPIADALAAAPRLVGGAPGGPWGTAMKLLFSGPVREKDDGFFYVGVLAVPAAVLALRRRGSLPMAIAAFAFLWLATGYALHPSLFALLRKLPLYASLRYPERFLVPFALTLAVLGARGIGAAEIEAATARRARRPALVRPAAWTLLAAACFTLVGDLPGLVAQHVLHARERELAATPVPGPPDASFHQARGNRWALAYYGPMQRGSLSCWEAYPVPESPLLRGNLDEEEQLLDPSAGSAIERRWSPNAIDVEVDLARPATLAVNQNWNSGWRTSEGTIVSRQGLLTVELPAGKRTVSLRFRPRSAVGGALVTLVAGLAAGWIGWGRRRWGARLPAWTGGAPALAGLTMLPAVPLALVLATVHEDRYVPPVVTMAGDPVVSDGLPEGAIRVDARFEGGMVLEAATLPNLRPRAGSDQVLELDWRKEPGAEEGIGVFMHFEPSSGKGMNGDHALLSGVLDPDLAPTGKTLRDVMPLWAPSDSRGKSWKIWVGLWRLRGNGQRLRIVDPGGARVDNDRVLVGTLDVR